MMVTTPLQQAEQTVLRLTGQWQGAPPVNVVDSVSDLPVSAPADVRGMLMRGVAWVVRDTQPMRYVPQTVAHEVIGHHAMRATLGASWRSFMGALQSGLRAGDARLSVARAHVREAYVDDGGKFNLSSFQESDEIAAYVAELGFDGDSGRMQIDAPVRRRLQAAAGHFCREALFMDRPVCFDELVGMLLASEHRLRHGGPVWGLGYRLRRGTPLWARGGWWYSAGMPKAKPMGPSVPAKSLAESERLLDRRGDWSEELKETGATLALVGCVGGAVVVFGYFTLLIFGVIRL